MPILSDPPTLAAFSFLPPGLPSPLAHLAAARGHLVYEGEELIGLHRLAGAVLDHAILAGEHRGEAAGLNAVPLPGPGGVLGGYRPAVEGSRLLLEVVAAQQVALREAAPRSFEEAFLVDVAVVRPRGTGRRSGKNDAPWPRSRC